MTPSAEPLKVVVVGVGQMGRSHLQAYHKHPSYHIVGIVVRSKPNLPADLAQYQDCIVSDLAAALALKPDVVSINTHTETHAPYAIAAMEAGAHVFVEKPLATNISEAKEVVGTAKRTGRKLVVGYILRHHPSYVEFIRQARLLGPPFVMRMNLNQRSTGEAWAIHKKIMEKTSPVVDCGVHYIDVMLQITDARPTQVRGMGVRLTEEIKPDQVNYAHLQITFDDGSVGWYEAGWGPMISETAYSIKDVMSPGGSVSIHMENTGESADVESHTRMSSIRVAPTGKEKRTVPVHGDANHDSLCALEQEFLLKSILEDWDLTKHMDDAVRSLAIVLAADTSMRENRQIDLSDIF